MAAPTDGEAVDIEICEALRRGERKAAFTSLARHYGPSMHTLCDAILRDRARAEDVMQETLMKAYKNIDQLRDPTRVRPWLKRIAINSCMDVLRQRRRERGNLEKLELEAAEPAIDEAPPAVEQEREHEALRECLETLPPEKLAAVLGRHFNGMSYEELALAMGEKTDTVRRRVDRALPALRDCLERKGVKP